MSSRSKSSLAAAKRKKFGEILLKLRHLRGHATAQGFYQVHGGDEYFHISYKHYLMIEAGERLPSVESFEKILTALLGVPLTGKAPERRELCRSYLEALGEGCPIFEDIWEETALVDNSTSVKEEMLNDMARRKVQEVPRPSNKQAKLVYSSTAILWCHQWLLQTGRSLSPNELAAAVKREVKEVIKALEALEEEEIVKKNRAGKYHSNFAETDVFISNPRFVIESSAWLSQEIDAVKKEGDPNGTFFMSVESQKEVELFVEFFRETLRKAYLYRKRGPIKGPGFICSAEWRFFKLFEFPKDQDETEP